MAGDVDGEGREAHWLTQAGRAAAAAQPRVVTRFVEAIGGWTQRTVARVANLVQKGLFEILVCSNYQPSDADMRCAGGGRCRRRGGRDLPQSLPPRPHPVRRNFLLACSIEDILTRLTWSQGVYADVLAQWENREGNVAKIEAVVRHLSKVRVRLGRAGGGLAGRLSGGALASARVSPGLPSSTLGQ